MSPNPCSEKRCLSSTVTTSLNMQVAGRTLHELKLATMMAATGPGAFVVKINKVGSRTTTTKCEPSTSDSSCAPILKIKHRGSLSIDKGVPKPFGYPTKYKGNGTQAKLTERNRIPMHSHQTRSLKNKSRRRMSRSVTRQRHTTSVSPRYGMHSANQATKPISKRDRSPHPIIASILAEM